MREQMAEFFATADGKPAMKFQWDQIWFPKKEIFIFSRDTNGARPATEEEMRTQAKLGAFSMGSSKLAPFGVAAGIVGGLVAGLAARAIGALKQSGDGKSAVAIAYKNPQGFPGFQALQLIRALP